MNPDPLQLDDEEPWAVAEDDAARGMFLGCLLILAVAALAFLAGRLLP